MIAGSQEQPDYWNLWDRPEVLFNVRPIKVVQCDTESEVAGLARNPSHLLLGTEEEFFRRAEHVLERVGEVLAFQDEWAWRRQQPFLRSVLRRFCAEDSDAPAWLSVVPCRVSFEYRFETGGAAMREVRPIEWIDSPSYLASGEHVASHQLDLGYGIGRLGLESVVMGGGPQARPQHARLVRQLRTRSLTGHGKPELSDLVFYVADPGADRDLIDRGARAGHVGALRHRARPVDHRGRRVGQIDPRAAGGRVPIDRHISSRRRLDGGASVGQPLFKDFSVAVSVGKRTAIASGPRVTHVG